MLQLDFHSSGRHFLQIPGPSPVPERILRAMSYPTIDHRGPEFGALGRKILADIKKIFKTEHPVSALAAILSPVVSGYVIDRFGSWDLPFIGSMVLMAIGVILAFRMHPEIRFESDVAQARFTPAPGAQ